MILSRAEEIMKSPKKIEVTYHNSSVWLENINKTTGKVQVKDLANNTTKEVSATELVEAEGTLKM